MKLYKSYILAGLIALGFTACDTDDLERDINALKDRVENYEAQVQKLNDDMNIIRVLLDGNKTISEWSYDGSTYTLKLSNGETLTLTEGVVGTNYPSIEIGDNDNWIIAGKDSGIRAVAKDGDDATFTPQFKIEGETWWVSHDSGQTWSNLGVSATGTPTGGTSPIASYDIENNKFKVVLNGDPQNTYYIPIVEGLVCEITEPVVDSGELLYISSTTPTTLKVKVNIKEGDVLRAVAPVDWTVNIPEYTTGEQVLNINVTAPAKASKCKIAIELTRGLNSVTDEIVARTNTSNYYDDYMAGLEVNIGDFTLLKTASGSIINGEKVNLSATHISSSNTTINSDGIYFIDSGLTGIGYDISGGATKIIIGNNPTQRSTLKLSNSITLGSAQSSLYCKNIEMTLENSTVRILTVNNPMKNVVFDGCKFNIISTTQAQFSYLNAAKQTIEKVVFQNCIFNTYIDYVLLSFDKNEDKNLDVTFKNNIFFSSKNTIKAFKLLSVNNSNKNGGVNKLILQNNTFYNVHSTGAGMINGNINEMYISSNLFENSYEQSSNLVLLRRLANTKELYDAVTGEINSNYGYCSGNKIWQIQYGGTSPIGSEGIIKATETLFSNADPVGNLDFTVKDEYKGLGADL